MAKVIVINGMATSGKSTFVKLCQQINPQVVELSTVDSVKRIALSAGWDGEKDERGRKFLNDIKTAMDEYDSLSWKSVDRDIHLDSERIYFINAREPEDIQYFVNKYGATTVLMVNYRVMPITSNHADARVNDYNYDYKIVNSGDLDDLMGLAKVFMEDIKNKSDKN